jgi:hypothetical protein
LQLKLDSFVKMRVAQGILVGKRGLSPFAYFAVEELDAGDAQSVQGRGRHRIYTAEDRPGTRASLMAGRRLRNHLSR